MRQLAPSCLDDQLKEIFTTARLKLAESLLEDIYTLSANDMHFSHSRHRVIHVPSSNLQRLHEYICNIVDPKYSCVYVDGVSRHKPSHPPPPPPSSEGTGNSFLGDAANAVIQKMIQQAFTATSRTDAGPEDGGDEGENVNSTETLFDIDCVAVPPETARSHLIVLIDAPPSLLNTSSMWKLMQMFAHIVQSSSSSPSSSAISTVRGHPAIIWVTSHLQQIANISLSIQASHIVCRQGPLLDWGYVVAECLQCIFDHGLLPSRELVHEISKACHGLECDEMIEVKVKSLIKCSLMEHSLRVKATQSHHRSPPQHKQTHQASMEIQKIASQWRLLMLLRRLWALPPASPHMPSQFVFSRPDETGTVVDGFSDLIEATLCALSAAIRASGEKGTSVNEQARTQQQFKRALFNTPHNGTNPQHPIAALQKRMMPFKEVYIEHDAFIGLLKEWFGEFACCDWGAERTRARSAEAFTLACTSSTRKLLLAPCILPTLQYTLDPIQSNNHNDSSRHHEDSNTFIFDKEDAATPHATSIVYGLVKECARHINTLDLYNSFRSIIATDDGSSTDECMLVFMAAMNELCLLGFIAPLKKNLDYYERVVVH